MDLLQKKGPLSVVNFTQPWNSKFNNFSTFYDSYSNCMILFRDGFFVIWDMYDKQNGLGENAFTLNLATTYKKVYGACVHPEKNCLSLQVSDNALVILFLKENQAEEIKLTFAKARIIHAFSFLFGDDYNYFVATNISIDLYRIKIDSLKAKLVKNIVINQTEPIFYYEPTASVVVVVDNKGQCSPYFLNLYEQKQHKGKTFQIDISQPASQEGQQTQDARASLRASNRLSFTERAFGLFKKTELKFSLAGNPYNQNLNHLVYKNQLLGQETQSAQSQDPNSSMMSSQTATSHGGVRRQQHQILLTTMYHRVILMHYNPNTSQVQAYELDINQTFKNNGHIQIYQSSLSGKDLIQMQTIDNLLVIHNMDTRATQIYDLKLEDWNIPLLSEDVKIEYGLVNKGKYLSDMLQKEETRYQEYQNQAQSSQQQNQSQNDNLTGQRKESDDIDQQNPVDLLASTAEDNQFQNNLDARYSQENHSSVTTESNSQQIQENSDTIKIEDSDEAQKRRDILSQPEENKEAREFDIYDDGVIFVDPMILIDTKNYSCLTLRLHLERFAKTCHNEGRMMLSLLCRSRNKQVFLKYLRLLTIQQKLGLNQLSQVFIRINSIYKQASIERQTFKRKYQSSQGAQGRIVSENYLHQGSYIELLIIQLQRMSRLRANTSFIAKSLNNLLLEYHPTNRVLSGEVIVFQNEILEIFKDLISHSSCPLSADLIPPKELVPLETDKILKPRFVMSIFLEFLRSLIDNQIPQQPSQQNLLMHYILATRDFANLQNLLQFRVLTENADLARLLVQLGSKDSKEQKKCYYQPAFQIGLDMLKKVRAYDDIVIALLNEGQVLRALNFAVDYNVHSMKMLTFNQTIEQLRKEGKNKQAEIVMKRIMEVRKLDEAKQRSEREYKPILVEEE
ncbi:UNKNOWN [Stylonychia lemnae]|uniref:Mic1 domain-containing protein n=1 Tax=Stylonychia lemnae TaxID=5949 RepID=A0A078AK22_STYLE|nr:UNKNOWN [Stylonychia lemnae]|eukprot:CDW82519.1 UNKNOWN [Stylonychia lemnae]